MSPSSQITPVSHYTIWKIAGPMIVANISVPLLGIVDTAVVGHLNAPHYVGAVAVGTLIFSFLFWGFGFLRMATTGLTAQASGRADKAESHSILQKSLIFAFAIAVLLLLLQYPLSKFAFSIIESSDQVRHFGQEYFAIRIWSSPAILANYVILGWLIGQAETRTALWLVLIVNISNIILDILFVSILNLAIEGVAIASVIAEYMGLVFAYFVITKHHSPLIPIASNKSSFTLASMLTLHGNIFIRTLCLIFCFGFFTAQGAKQGDITLAANAILLHFITFMAFFLDGFANAAEVITGKAIGSGNRALLKQGIFYATIWSFAIATLFSLSYGLFGANIIRLLTSIPEVVTAAEQYLPWLILAPILAVWSYLFDGIFIGAMLSVEMRNTMLFSTFCCYFPAWVFLESYGNHGLWAALLIFLTARGLSQACYLPRILSKD
ncbi:MAG: MATE family multidrug resistance protein [Methylophagaceae bacterium]|jgi:MATE family multidrug resistance protein